MKHLTTKHLWFFAISMALVGTVDAQKKEKPLLRIDSEVSTMEEFEHMYEQNCATALTPISRQEYLQLFTNYKLKVAEAKAQGIDTTQNYVGERDYYINELSQSYLTDTTAVAAAKREERARLREEIKASHILISVSANASPADTAAAYAKALEARKKVLAGEPFDKVASEYSMDPSAKRNHGSLGYFSAMHMVKQFEDAAYNTPKDSTSDIIRTRFGYHFLHVFDRRPAEGEVRVQHIMCFVPRKASSEEVEKAKSRIDSIYGLLQSPDADFEALATQFSDDKQSAIRGGMLPWFTRSRILPEFAEAAFALKEKGELSVPIRTQAGWHIIRFIDRRTELPDNEFNHLCDRFFASTPSLRNIGFDSKIRQLAKSYAFTWNAAGHDSIVGIMLSSEDENVRTEKIAQLNMSLASYDGKTLPANTTAAMCQKAWNKEQTPSENMAALQNEIIASYERTQLASKYTDFRFTEREYTEGLLVFEVSQKRVWNAIPDSATMQQMYASNPSRYSSDGSFEGSIYFCNSIKDAEKIKTFLAKGKKEKAVKAALKVVTDSIKQGGEYDDIIWPNGAKSDYVVVDGTKSNGKQLPIEKCRGQIISDYQQLQDLIFVEELKKKHTIQILKKIK